MSLLGDDIIVEVVDSFVKKCKDGFHELITNLNFAFQSLLEVGKVAVRHLHRSAYALADELKAAFAFLHLC